MEPTNRLVHPKQSKMVPLRIQEKEPGVVEQEKERDREKKRKEKKMVHAFIYTIGGWTSKSWMDWSWLVHWVQLSSDEIAIVRSRRHQR